MCEPRDEHLSVRKRNQSSHTQQTTLLSITVLRSPSTYREPMITKWHKQSSGVGRARGEPRSSKLPQSSAGGGDARRHVSGPLEGIPADFSVGFSEGPTVRMQPSLESQLRQLVEACCLCCPPRRSRAATEDLFRGGTTGRDGATPPRP